MDVAEALARAESWRENPRMRPQPDAAKLVGTTLAARVRQLEQQLSQVKRLAAGRQVLIERGNPNRGPGTGPGFGRRVPAIIEEALVGDVQVRCKLLVDDQDAVAAPCMTGDSGLWSVSQIVIE